MPLYSNNGCSDLHRQPVVQQICLGVIFDLFEPLLAVEYFCLVICALEIFFCPGEGSHLVECGGVRPVVFIWATEFLSRIVS